MNERKRMKKGARNMRVRENKVEVVVVLKMGPFY